MKSVNIVVFLAILINCGLYLVTNNTGRMWNRFAYVPKELVVQANTTHLQVANVVLDIIHTQDEHHNNITHVVLSDAELDRNNSQFIPYTSKRPQEIISNYEMESSTSKPSVLPVPEEKTIVITNGTLVVNHRALAPTAFMNCPGFEPWMKCEYVPSYNGTISAKADAVLVRLFHSHKGITVPRSRPPQQKWIFYETESPFRAWTNERQEIEDVWGKFNISITYNADADIIYAPYSFTCHRDPSILKLGSNINYANGKNGSVLWLVSNCQLTMGRDLYVQELKKHIQVDIFGTCGQKTSCGEYSQENTTCIKQLIEQYKFYLAFESSLCEEYYTEKIHKTLETNTIPVVMGLVNYTEVLTPGTYIDVRDFKSPKHLAEYLLYLSSNHIAYNEYIIKKRQVKCLPKSHPRLSCTLCRYLHENRHRSQTLPDMRDHWGIQARCQSPKEFFTGIADNMVADMTKAKAGA